MRSFVTVDVIQSSWKGGREERRKGGREEGKKGGRKEEEEEEEGKYVSKVPECITRNLVSQVSH